MKNPSVLFLDDDQQVLLAITRMFADESYVVAVASNVDEALGIIASGTIKVVLSDQRMPGMSGIEFLRKIKMEHPDIVRILFTAYADLFAAEQAINISEVFRFINKPWHQDELKAAIVGGIQHFDLVEENRRLVETMNTKNEELLQTNNKLKVLYETQKDFSSTVSHELRTPLASIKAALDIVLSGTTGTVADEQKNFLSKAKGNVDRLNRLINDILDLAHMESGKSSLDKKCNDMNQIIRSVIESQKSVAENKGLYLKASMDPQLAQVPFDPDKIIQVLNNLISNAIKFTDSGGITVVSSLHAQANHIKVSIEDTGCGIQEEDVKKLFGKFQQLGEAHQRHSGTGLGLAICKEIVHQHAGKIGVESKVGRGSSFYFILPISERRTAR